METQTKSKIDKKGTVIPKSTESDIYSCCHFPDHKESHHPHIKQCVWYNANKEADINA